MMGYNPPQIDRLRRSHGGDKYSITEWTKEKWILLCKVIWKLSAMIVTFWQRLERADWESKQ